MKKTSVGFLVFLIAFLLISVWRYHHLGSSPSEAEQRTSILMDTLVRIEVFGQGEEQARASIDAAFEEMGRLSQVCSHYLPESEVSRINRNAGGPPVEISKDLFVVLQRSLHFSAATGGAFDVTVGAISQLYDLTAEEPKIPTSEKVEEKRGFIDYRKIRLDEGAGSIVTETGTVIDLGGAAKGFTVDRAIDILKQRGVQAALVDAGGDIGLLGTKSKEKPWRIGVQHPREATALYAVIDVDSGCVATSGDYQRYVLQDGQRYHHILDPVTGRPSLACISVTILARQALDADILATGVFVLGPEKGMALLDSLAGVEGLILYERNGRIEHRLSKGLPERITFQ